MVAYTTIINAVFTILIAAAFFFTASNTFLLNLLFYIIITPIITVTLNKIMFFSENKMIVADALARVDGIMDCRPLEESGREEQPKIIRLSLNLYLSDMKTLRKMHCIRSISKSERENMWHL